MLGMPPSAQQTTKEVLHAADVPRSVQLPLEPGAQLVAARPPLAPKIHRAAQHAVVAQLYAQQQAALGEQHAVERPLFVLPIRAVEPLAAVERPFVQPTVVLGELPAEVKQPYAQLTQKAGLLVADALPCV